MTDNETMAKLNKNVLEFPVIIIIVAVVVVTDYAQREKVTSCC